MAMHLPSARGKGRRAPMAEINVTPLVDVMLVLLVIFMVTAPMLSLGVPVDLPRAAAARLSPPEPSFLHMRNAILQADQVLNNGANVAAIWAVFAARGMGFFASTQNGDDATPIEDFSLPPSGGSAQARGLRRTP